MVPVYSLQSRQAQFARSGGLCGVVVLYCKRKERICLLSGPVAG